MVVESFKRLYDARKLTKEQIEQRVSTGVIDAEEYKYITEEEVEA